MNRQISIFLLVFLLITPQVWGATPQYPNPYRQTIWNNLTDSINTLGQSPIEAAQTKRILHAQRARARIRSITAAQRASLLKNVQQRS